MDDKYQHPGCHICLVVMCGLPGAGKTTLTKKLISCNSLNFKCTSGSATSSSDTSTSTCDTSASTCDTSTSTSALMMAKIPSILLVQFDDIIPRELPVNDRVTARQDTDDRSDKGDGIGNNKASSTIWKQYRKDTHSVIERLLNRVSQSYKNSECLTQKSLHDNVISTLETLCEENAINGTVVEAIRNAIMKQTWGSDPEEMDLKQEGCECLVLILDDNMFYRSMRFEYYQLARKYGTGFAQIYLQCPVSIAMARNESREYPVAMDTIINMASNMEVPDPVKAPWEEYISVVDAEKQWSEDDLKRIWCVIDQALAKPAPPYQEIDTKEQEESRKASLASVLHQADVTLRKSVAEMIKTNKSQNQPSKLELQQLARTLNGLRTEILNEIRHNQLDVPPILTCEDQETQETQNKNFQDFIREHFHIRYTDVRKETPR